ncbi:hypothetical protein ASC94_25495 [Massilia sp. Root418]|jgi:MSHA biogenesis protein MshQ|uniref:DUF6701 domain-containing protein n=1 Tax=Massilia sp. Root418 TaxID=1736532 RepID=UPI000700EC54|nr:DUF6701 domain-containing protein [Massilia sp. Root418]KQW87853.1 hypothetical protein ASC94_25495 [Massilia sp. Root418]
MASSFARGMAWLGTAPALLLALALALLPAGPARANTAVLYGGGVVAGCSYAAASSTYTCAPFPSTQDVTIASGYTVVLTGPIDFDYNQQLNMSGTAQLRVAGNLDIAGIKASNLNITGGSLISSGQFSMGAQPQTIVADVSAASMKIGTGSTTKVTGNLTATGQIDIASHATIIGDISGGKVTTGSPVSLTGDVTASVSFNLSSGSTLDGNLVSPVVSLDPSPSRVNGNVTASTSLTIGSSSSINGNVVAGAVVLQSSEAYITGTALVDTLKLNWHGRVYQAVTCRNYTSGNPCTCVDDDSGYSNTSYATVCTAPATNNAVHHYQITHDGAGLTCQPEAVTVKACANADCSALYNGTAQLKLAPNSVDSPAPTVSVAGAGGTGYVRQTTAGNATLAVVANSASPAPTAGANSTVCIGGGTGTPCVMKFSEAGFDVSAVDHKAGESAQFTVKAMMADQANPSSCIPLIANSSKTIVMRCGYVDPSSNTNPNIAGRNVSLAGESPSTAALACGSGSPSGGAAGNLSLRFDQNGVARGTMVYNDVGKVALSAEYTAGNANFVTGRSTDILVAPYKYSIVQASKANHTPASNAAGEVFAKAGEVFAVRVTALSMNDVATSNFGRESKPGQFELTHALVDPAPAAGNAGTLTAPDQRAMGIAINAGAAGATPGSFLINNLSWNEVGIIQITATTLTGGDYAGIYKGMAAALAGKGSSGNVGRFIPDHFDVTLAGAGAPPFMACPAAGIFPISCSGGWFVYAGQPFGLNLAAMSGGSAPALTRNYAGSYARAIGITAWNAAGATGNANDNPEYRPLDNAATSMPARPEDVGGPGGPTVTTDFTFTAGTGQGGVKYAFTKDLRTADQLTKISRPVNVFFRATDSDAVTSLRAGAVEAGLAVAAGRLQVAHSYGSPLLKRRVEVESQYWTGTQFLHNRADFTQSTGALAGSGMLTYEACTRSLNPGGACYAIGADSTPPTLLFDTGRSFLRLNAPGLGRDGSVNLRVNAIPWLPSTAGRLTYGVYRSPVIYLRELH